jgi:hypothetical protein
MHGDALAADEALRQAVIDDFTGCLQTSASSCMFQATVAATRDKQIYPS